MPSLCFFTVYHTPLPLQRGKPCKFHFIVPANWNLRFLGLCAMMKKKAGGHIMQIRFAIPEDVPGMIAARDRSKAGMTAPPFGLYLNKVVD